MTAQEQTHHLTITLDIEIREANRQDISQLEWHGQFIHFRRIFRRAFREQKQGKRLMLVADHNGYPVGRLFILFYSKNTLLANGYSRAYIYSFHVMDLFQGHGIGTHLMDTAESVLMDRGYHTATLAVAKDNHGAMRLYERRGYTIIDDDEGKWRYYDHRGRIRYVHEPCWLLEKNLKSV